ncbi:MAG: phosphodiester glycosidase family protein [Oscillospiraceae bacterium]|nr:phosphodiester glycosidase family protein [Oscillospiraceae bacterium]
MSGRHLLGIEDSENKATPVSDLDEQMKGVEMTFPISDAHEEVKQSATSKRQDKGNIKTVEKKKGRAEYERAASDGTDRKMPKELNNKSRNKRKFVSVLGRILAFLGVSIGTILVVLLGLVWVLEKGPSPTLTGSFTRSMRETSAIRWIPSIFLSEDELAEYISVNTEQVETDTVNTSLIHIADKAEAVEEQKKEYLQLIDIAMGTCKGKLLIVRDPKNVILGTSEEFGKTPGLQLTDMVAKYDGLAGINAGGFNDMNGMGDGGRPQGLVIVDSQITWGTPEYRYNVVGIDNEGILRIGTMSGTAAIEQGMKWAVSFVTHDGLASALIINGEVQSQNLGSGVNPRTAIGQRDDGSLLLLVLDGRSINTLGATMEDIVNVMLEYGAVNAGNLDGGSSSVMVYGGEIINNCASVTGPRRIPTGFIVLKEGDGNA